MFNSSCVVMIPARVRTLLGVLLLAVASPAQKGGDMPQLIDKVMLQAAERYADMASGLEKAMKSAKASPSTVPVKRKISSASLSPCSAAS